jgi:hypothetical protein
MFMINSRWGWDVNTIIEMYIGNVNSLKYGYQIDFLILLVGVQC